MELLALIGLFVCPIFTIGCVLVHFDYQLIGTVIILYSLFGTE